jgi:hypothetical protein
MLVTICNWSALLTIGVVNLLVPIAVYREVREESKTRRRFCSKRKKGGVHLSIWLFMRSAYVHHGHAIPGKNAL